MDFSPVIISLKTAVCALLIVFLPEPARLAGYEYSKTAAENRNGQSSDITVSSAPYSRPFIALSFGVNRPLGRFFLDVFGVKIAFSFASTVIASAFVSFPMMYRSARGAFEQVDPHLLDAARTLGMGETKIFLRILLPNSIPGLLSGSVLAFTRGLGEFGATAMLAGNIAGRTRPSSASAPETAINRMNYRTRLCRDSDGICIYLNTTLMNPGREYQNGEIKHRRKSHGL